MLSEDAMQPWPAMLVELILSTEPAYREGNLIAFASLCKVHEMAIPRRPRPSLAVPRLLSPSLVALASLW